MQIEKDDTVTFTPVPSPGVASGDPLKVGDAFGICQTDADRGAEVEAAVEGVHRLPNPPAR